MVVEIIGISIGVQIYLMHLGAVLEGFADACGGYFARVIAIEHENDL